MNPAKFIEARSPIWSRVEEITRRAQRRGVRRLSDEDLRTLTRQYPTIAVDVARARTLDLDELTVRRLNQIAIAAHGLLYSRKKQGSFLKTIARFFAGDYPRLFRKLLPYFALSFSITAVCTFGAYTSVRIDPSTAYLFVPRGLDVDDESEVSAADVSERYRKMPGSVMASMITTNNIQVAAMAFTFGILLGVGTMYVLATNGMMLGGFFGHFAINGLLGTCFEFLVPHGALEIFAIIVAGAAGMRIGLSFAMPGRLTRGASLRRGAKEGTLLMLGTVPMFIVAGMLESYVTPSYLEGGLKIVIGLATLGITLAYLLLTGLRTRPEEAKAAV